MPNMKIINLDSKYVPTPAQLSFAENVIEFGEHEPMRSEDSLAVLASEIPIFLLSAKGMDKTDRVGASSSMDFWGFYCHELPIGTSRKPAIGLCLERMIGSCKTEEELTILFAKVLIHELAHAKMTMHPGADYGPPDEFYAWMEEPMANLIVLETFDCYQRCHQHSASRRDSAPPFSTIASPLAQVRLFMEMQPDNYRLGIDLFDTGLRKAWWNIWRRYKSQFSDESKYKWIEYTKANVGKADKGKLFGKFGQQILALPVHCWEADPHFFGWIDEVKRIKSENAS